MCNLCLSVLEHGGADHDEPPPKLRSSLRQHVTISAPIEASARPPLSQFSASQLFPRNDSPYQAQSEGNFDRISEGSSRRVTPTSDDGLARQDYVNLDDNRGLPLGVPRIASGTSPPTTAIAPFRRNMAEDDKTGDGNEGLGIVTDGLNDSSALENGPRSPVGVPPPSIASGHEPSKHRPNIDHVLSTSSIILAQGSSDDQSMSEPPTRLHLRPPNAAPVQLAAPVTTLSPALPYQERTLSRLSSYVTDNALTPNVIYPDLPPDGDYDRFMIDASAQQGPFNLQPSWDRIPLAQVSIEHIRTMLQQSLAQVGIANPKTWEKVLLDLLLRIADNLQPDSRAGDDIDVRAYVHVKKIPGGHPRDSEYVDGFVFTKNVMHKKMIRQMANPRIMLLALPLEYQRVENQLMSLEPLLKQEKEYLYNLVQRIAALRPHILLVEKNVSRLALEYLMARHIAVARNVKRDAIDAISRATQADVITSIDKLALEPRLGRCGTFRVQTFVHSMIPGQRKTFMRFEGCSKDLECTILLRGGPMDVLAKIKKILDTMIIVVYNAKLEGYLFRDEILYARDQSGAARPQRRQASTDGSGTLLLDELQVPEQERISQDVAKALKPYEAAALSGSAFVHFPPPYPLARMSEEDRRVKALRRLREYEETEQILHEEAASKQATSISASSSTVSLRSLSSERGSQSTTTSSAQVVSALSKGTTARLPDDALKVLQTPKELARLTEFDEAEERHAELLAVWDAYLAMSKDSFDPGDHQHFFVLEAKIIILEEKSPEDRQAAEAEAVTVDEKVRVCSPPAIRQIAFYGENDCTLGQYIERSYRDMGKLCEATTCGRHNLAHHRTWVHGPLRLLCVPEAHHFGIEDRSNFGGGKIVMFSSCTVCGARSGQTVMSDETYHISFGKYLQLSFYGAHDDLVRADGLCEHNPRTQHHRYFNFRGITFRFYIEQIDLRNVVPPPRFLKIKPETQLELRNEEYITVLKRSTAFWDSIMHRIASFNYELVQADRLNECRQAMADLSSKCEADRRAMVKLLESTYEHVQATNGTEMTGVRRALQNKAVDWEAEWTSFEQRIIPSEKDVRRLTTVQLKRLFSNDGVPLSPERKVTGPSLPPAIEAEEKDETVIEEKKSVDRASEAPHSPAEDTSQMTLQADLLESMPFPPEQLLPLSTRSLKATMPSPDDNDNDDQSDSTVCADPPDAESGAQLPSPYYYRRHSHRPDDTSGAESEASAPMRRNRTSQGIAQLVDFFSFENTDARSSTAASGPATDSNAKSPARPTLRRGQTEHKTRPKSRVNPKDVLSDGDGSCESHLSHLTRDRS